MNRGSLFDLMVDYIDELAITVAADGRVSYANHYAKERLEYGDDIYDYLISDIFPGEFTIENGKLSYEQRDNAEKRQVNAYRRNRTCFPMALRVVPYRDTDAVLLCLSTDVSEQVYLQKKVVQIEKEAEDALKVKSEFVANVTHELRTPVNGILGNTKELVQNETDPYKRKKLSLVERGCRDMNAIINNILDFSKLEAGKFSLELREFDFYNMMEYIKSNHINKITEKGLDFEMNIAPQIPKKLIGDELRIGQVLNNLLSNACKFTAVGKVTLEVVMTARVGDRIELFFFVVDTGIGLDSQEQEKLFKSFSQVDASISRRYGGTGLGLNISKQLVELMDGQIGVESEKGKGTMFSFSVWVKVPQQAETLPSETIEPSSYQLAQISKWEENNVRTFGEKENLEELSKRLSKLSLSIDMDNWEKAETLAESIKELTEEAPKEIKSAVLRLKMSVQKGDYDKTVSAHDKLKVLLFDS
jgi:signal transduction histidine kinase